MIKRESKFVLFFLFDLILYVPVNSFSVRLEPGTIRSRVTQSTTEPLRSSNASEMKPGLSNVKPRRLKTSLLKLFLRQNKRCVGTEKSWADLQQVAHV